MDIIEDIARQRISNWQVPPRPEQTRVRELINHGATAQEQREADVTAMWRFSVDF